MDDSPLIRFCRKLATMSLFVMISWMAFAFISAFSPLISTRYFYQEHGYGTLHNRMNDWAESRDDLDILIVGPSVAYRSFHPKPFEESGLKIFNLGTDSQTLPVTANVLEHALRESQPRLVIIPMFSDLWEHDSTESRSNWIMHNQIQNWNWNRLSFEMCFRESSLRLLLQMVHSKTKAFLTNTFSSLRNKPTDRYLRRGYTGSTLSLHSSPECSRYLELKVSNQQNVCNPIKKIKLLCNGANSKLMFIWTPTLCERRFQFECPIDIIVDGNKWKNKEDPGMYFDESHLTTQGAASYSQWILDTEIQPFLSEF